jgi:hypothetical protein
MATQNSLLIGARKYRGITIRPALGGAWKVRTVGWSSETQEKVIFDVNARTLEHARDIIKLSIENGRYFAFDGDLFLHRSDS